MSSAGHHTASWKGLFLGKGARGAEAHPGVRQDLSGNTAQTAGRIYAAGQRVII